MFILTIILSLNIKVSNLLPDMTVESDSEVVVLTIVLVEAMVGLKLVSSCQLINIIFIEL